MIQELKNLVMDLISFKTQNQDLNEINKCICYIKEYFKGTDYVCDITETNKVKSLFIHKLGEYKLDCIFNGHIDVVPANENQFKPYIKEDRLYGRGAIDMKSQIAIFLYFLKHYNGNKKIGALLTSDEEIGGANGTPMALKNLNISAKVAIVPDAGYNFQLINSERGVLQLNIDVVGKSVHSSIEPNGINALCRAVDLYKKIKRELNKKSPNSQTVNLAKLSTENQVYNKVPDQANMLIDIRYNVKTDINYVFNLLNECEYAKYFIYEKAEPFNININNEYIEKYLKICEKTLNRKIDVVECFGASDARFFAQKNIPVIMMNPSGKDMHGENECIKIESFDLLLKIYENFIREM